MEFHERTRGEYVKGLSNTELEALVVAALQDEAEEELRA